MKLSYYIIVLLLILGIQSKAQNSDSLNIAQDTTQLMLKKIGERRLTKHIIEQYMQYENLTLKISAKTVINEKKYNLNLQFRSIKDSLIWININHVSGYPVGRFLISKDSLKFMDRMKKKYIRISNDKIQEKLKYNVNYKMISAILTGELINLHTRKKTLGAYSKYKAYKTQTGYIIQNIKQKRLERLIRKNKADNFLIHINTIDSTYKLLDNSIIDYVNKQNLHIAYKAYNKKNKAPKRIELTISRTVPISSNKSNSTELKATEKQEQITVKMKIKKVKIDSKRIKFPFSVPKKYEIIE